MTGSFKLAVRGWHLMRSYGKSPPVRSEVALAMRARSLGNLQVSESRTLRCIAACNVCGQKAASVLLKG